MFANVLTVIFCQSAQIEPMSQGLNISSNKKMYNRVSVRLLLNVGASLCLCCPNFIINQLWTESAYNILMTKLYSMMEISYTDICTQLPVCMPYALVDDA